MGPNKIISYRDFRIEKLSIDHIGDIKKWGHHDDPLLWEYDISKKSKMSLYSWCIARKRTSKRSYYAVYHGPIMVGYFGFRNISRIKKSADLGIALDPTYTSKGYGSEIMKLLLEYYFKEKGMKKLKLEVNNFNLRAINLYKKFDFRIVGESIAIFPIADESLDILSNKEFFTYKMGKLYSITTKMVLSREEYDEIPT